MRCSTACTAAISEPTNPDMLAFHEAFADIVALFQHFTMPECCSRRSAIAAGRAATCAAEPAGRAWPCNSARRTAHAVPCAAPSARQAESPDRLRRTATEPHERGAVLVAAVFEPSSRSTTAGRAISSAWPPAAPACCPRRHPARPGRAAGATKRPRSPTTSCTICIRALDYCPPVDLTFGEYLRALITADRDLSPADDRRLSRRLHQAFRERGIYPSDVLNLSVDTLAWQSPMSCRTPWP